MITDWHPETNTDDLTAVGIMDYLLDLHGLTLFDMIIRHPDPIWFMRAVLRRTVANLDAVSRDWPHVLLGLPLVEGL